MIIKSIRFSSYLIVFWFAKIVLYPDTQLYFLRFLHCYMENFRNFAPSCSTESYIIGYEHSKVICTFHADSHNRLNPRTKCQGLRSHGRRTPYRLARHQCRHCRGSGQRRHGGGSSRHIPLLLHPPAKQPHAAIGERDVSGYDVGTLLSGTCTTLREKAPDGDGPTGRIKLGTESNGGFRHITIRLELLQPDERPMFHLYNTKRIKRKRLTAAVPHQ